MQFFIYPSCSLRNHWFKKMRAQDQDQDQNQDQNQNQDQDQDH